MIHSPLPPLYFPHPRMYSLEMWARTCEEQQSFNMHCKCSLSGSNVHGTFWNAHQWSVFSDIFHSQKYLSFRYFPLDSVWCLEGCILQPLSYRRQFMEWCLPPCETWALLVVVLFQFPCCLSCLLPPPCNCALTKLSPCMLNRDYTGEESGSGAPSPHRSLHTHTAVLSWCWDALNRNHRHGMSTHATFSKIAT